MSKLDKEEKELLDSFERGEWISDKNLPKRKSELKEYARARNGEELQAEQQKENE